jgi:hypothetical protein
LKTDEQKGMGAQGLGNTHGPGGQLIQDIWNLRTRTIQQDSEKFAREVVDD